MRKLISIVFPVYNNQGTLRISCEQVLAIHRSDFPHHDIEILFVNDGSRDESWDELISLKREFGDVIRPINLSRNFGQLGALYAGFNNAKGDAVICISADLQDPISLMGQMVKTWDAGVEIVVCNRKSRKDGFFTGIFSKIAYAVARVSVPDLPRGGFDYWLMSRRVCKHLCSFKGRHNFLQGYLLSVGYSKAFIPYTRIQRAEGKSGYSLGKKIKILIDFMVDSSYLPIRGMSCLGALLAVSGLIYSVMIVYARIRNETPFPGWAPIMIMLMIIGGMIMIMLGVIGEYIWRIYDNQRDFPLFIVEKENSKELQNERHAPMMQQ